MQVDRIEPTVKAPGTKRLKLECAILLSTVAFKFNLCRYTLGKSASAPAPVRADAAMEADVRQSLQSLIGSVLGGTMDPKTMKANLLQLKPHLNGLLNVVLVKVGFRV